MSMFKYGDTVIIYEDRNKQSLVTLIENGQFQNQFGSFQHSQIVNQLSGSKIYSKNNRFIYVLTASSVLISATVPHKTQILYQMDIAQIIQRLNIIPGSRIIETGTGSGSLSCSILNNIQNEGHLFTFEFNLERVNNAIKLFEKMNFKNVTVIQRDTCGQGFECQEDQKYELGIIDAVFLDVPKPWEAVVFAHKVLKRSGRICCFSPCSFILYKVLKRLGFTNIVTIESLQREYQNIHKQDKFNFSIQKKPIFQEEQKEDQQEEQQDKSQNQILNKRKRSDGPEQKNVQQEKKVFLSSGQQSQKGHTGYLTFAILA